MANRLDRNAIFTDQIYNIINHHMDKRVVLKKRKDQAIRRFHPWVFSGAVERTEGELQDGDLVAVCSNKEEILGWGHYQDSKITVRMLTFGTEAPEVDIWEKKIQSAWALRRELGLADAEHTNAFRLVHGEGDGLPGLIIDLYGETAVLQCHSAGMYRQRERLVHALRRVLGEELKAIYDKSSDHLPPTLTNGTADGYLWGQSQVGFIREHGHEFLVDWEKGQKTGFFLDQRENRLLLGRYAAQKSVLNLYAYSGGFSVYALQAGARDVVSVDSSARALEWARENVERQGAADRHELVCEDVLSYLKNLKDRPEIIVVDPPAFAKNVHKRHKAVQAYKRLNALALKKLAPDGLLFTFSCSEVVGPQLFLNTLVAAALETGREVQILHRLSQPADHPVGLFHPEGNYLKGLVLRVK